MKDLRLVKIALKSLLLTTLPQLLLLSCTPTEESDIFQQEAVVEAYLHADHPIELLISAKTALDTEVQLANTTGLSVEIEADGQTYPMTGDGQGGYQGPENLLVQPGARYRLRFIFEGQEVTAATTVPTKPTEMTLSSNVLEIPSFSGGPGGGIPQFPDPLDIAWTNQGDGYFLVVAENIETDPAPINEDGEGHPRFFRAEPIQGNSIQLNPFSFDYYGTYRIILFHLNAEYAALYQESGDNSQNLVAPSTNVGNGLGIFTGIHSDTLQLEVSPI